MLDSRVRAFLARANQCLGHSELFSSARGACFQPNGIGILTCVRSALTLAATTYRKCYASTFATDHETRLVLFAQKTRAITLAPSHHRDHRECTFIEAWLHSLRVEVCGPVAKLTSSERLQLPTRRR